MKNLMLFEDFKSPLKFYHTSGTKYKYGDVIGGPGKLVFLNITPVPHYTIWPIIEYGYDSWDSYQKASEETWKRMENLYGEEIYNNTMKWEDVMILKRKLLVNPKEPEIRVYEVKPFDPPTFNKGWDEYIATGFVEIIRNVGNAKGILNNYKTKKKNKGAHSIAGAKSYRMK